MSKMWNKIIHFSENTYNKEYWIMHNSVILVLCTYIDKLYDIVNSIIVLSYLRYFITK